MGCSSSSPKPSPLPDANPLNYRFKSAPVPRVGLDLAANMMEGMPRLRPAREKRKQHDDVANLFSVPVTTMSSAKAEDVLYAADKDPVGVVEGSQSNSTLFVSAGQHNEKGRFRSWMEDRVTCQASLNSKPWWPVTLKRDACFFGVFDGHGGTKEIPGDEVSEYLRDNLARVLFTNLAQRVGAGPSDSTASPRRRASSLLQAIALSEDVTDGNAGVGAGAGSGAGSGAGAGADAVSGAPDGTTTTTATTTTTTATATPSTASTTASTLVAASRAGLSTTSIGSSDDKPTAIRRSRSRAGSDTSASGRMQQIAAEVARSIEGRSQAAVDEKVAEAVARVSKRGTGALARLPSLSLLVNKSADFPSLLTHVFRTVDEDVLSQPFFELAGSTCTVAFLYGNALVVANTGDSDAYLCRAGVPHQLTTHHKCKVDSEYERIVNAGGDVLYFGGAYRIEGMLEVSRTFGVPRLKSSAKGLIPDPHVAIAELCEEDEFLVIGSDGLFEAFPNPKHMMKAIKTSLRITKSADLTCRGIVQDVTSKGKSTDNVSMVLVCFNQGGQTSLAGACGGSSYFASTANPVLRAPVTTRRGPPLAPSVHRSISHTANAVRIPSTEPVARLPELTERPSPTPSTPGSPDVGSTPEQAFPLEDLEAAMTPATATAVTTASETTTTTTTTTQATPTPSAATVPEPAPVSPPLPPPVVATSTSPPVGSVTGSRGSGGAESFDDDELQAAASAAGVDMSVAAALVNPDAAAGSQVAVN